MVLSARAAALTALERCRRDGVWSGAAIDNAIKKYALDKRDSAFAATLCLGVLQNSSLCDYYIDLYRSRTSDKLEPKVRDILRLGVYQLLFMTRVPARAAVNETVELCRSGSLSRAAGLVNAVLRRVSENRDNLPEVPDKGTAQYLSTRYSHPLWLCQRIMDEFGYDFAEGFLSCNNNAPELDIQLNRLKTDWRSYSQLLTECGIEHRVHEFPEGCLSLAGGNVAKLPGFEDGLFYVQDRAARIAAELACAKPGMRVLDACAAPGGKSLAMAIGMHNQGSITSCDISEKKLGLISDNARRLGIDIISVEKRDARSYDETMAESYDLVMADVPCSGLGVIGKKPEIRLKKADEISGLPEIQLAILENLSRYVKPGGVLIYSTCTVLKPENEDVVNTFLTGHSDFALEQIQLENMLFHGGMHTFWPHIDGTDGFFAARLIRKAL